MENSMGQRADERNVAVGMIRRQAWHWWYRDLAGADAGRLAFVGSQNRQRGIVSFWWLGNQWVIA
ncbi:MAG: hypothetical protein AAF989_00860 [Planctomycetota bacterium]